MLFECEQYEEALEFEKRKEQITDSSENEMNSHLSRQGRKRKTPKNYDFTEDIEEDSSDWSIARPPKLPTIDEDGQSRTSTTSTISLDEDFLKMPPPPPVTNGKVINTNGVDADSNYHHATENNTYDDHRHHIAEREENDNSKSSKEYSGCCDHGRILKDILENSVAVRTILNEHRRILENIGTKGEGRPTIITDFETVPKKPFSLMRKLMKYEDILRNSEEAEKQLETAFFIIGGDANNSIRRGLGKLLSNKLAMKCSFYGRKGNYALKDLKCVTILREALRKRFGLSFSDKDFQNTIAQWLKQASLRYVREQRKLETTE